MFYTNSAPLIERHANNKRVSNSGELHKRHIPWLCNNLRIYILCAHCDNIYCTRESILILDWKKHTKQFTTINLLNTVNSGWNVKIFNFGTSEYNFLSLSNIQIVNLFESARLLTCLNSASRPASVFLGTNKVVSSVLSCTPVGTTTSITGQDTRWWWWWWWGGGEVG